jgi:hypothetical protein
MQQNFDRTWVARPVHGAMRTPWGRILVLLVLGLSGMTAEASPIKRHAHLAGSPGSVRVWEEFVAKGPSYWAQVDPPEMSSQTSRAMHHLWAKEFKSADPAWYPEIQYLLWRRALDPVRFDHWHPGMGKALESLLPTLSPGPTTTLGSNPQTEPVGPTTTSSATSPATLPNVVPTSAVSPETVAPSAGTPSPASIPEPGTLTLAMVLCASELFRRLWNGRSRCCDKVTR